MGLFDFFKKDKEEQNYDPTNLRVTNLAKNFVFEYDLKNWVVDEVYHYNWGEGYNSKEYKVNAGDEVKFLSVDNDDELEISLAQKVKVRVLQEDLPEYILDNDKPPKKLEYKGITFYYDGEMVGELYNPDDEEKEGARFISWDYYDEDENYILTVEQWGEEEFEASFGKLLKEYEISNILPGE